MRSRTIVAAFAAPLMVAGTLALSAGSASAATWQDTSIQVNQLHVEETYPTAPAVAATGQGKITVTRAAATDLLSVNSQASRLPARGDRHRHRHRYHPVRHHRVRPPTGRSPELWSSRSTTTSRSDAALAEIIRFSDDPVTGGLTLGSVYIDAPSAITRS